MRALTVKPGAANSATLSEVPEPDSNLGSVLVRTRAIGICGTDAEIVSGAYGWAPPGEERLIIGHESLGVVEEAPPDAGVARGDLVVGIVRRPDPLPCISCARGEWDMCRNGLYTERGIKERHGYCSERFRIEPEFVVKVDPALGLRAVLLEPASVVAKAWEQVERIGSRGIWEPHRVLVTGAGPVGLLAALMAAQRGYEVTVFDRVEGGPKARLVEALGGRYHSGTLGDLALKPDIVMECTGASPVIVAVAGNTSAAGVVCLTGVSSGGTRINLDVGALNRSIVLENDVVFGSVNANRRHYEQAAQSLAKADPNWLDGVISRREPLKEWRRALVRRPDDVKVVLDFEL
jgi:threonine dehydrogenase-like Zn-dependent dehydrogenase